MTRKSRQLSIDEVEILAPDVARRMSNQGLSSISMEALLDRFGDGETRQGHGRRFHENRTKKAKDVEVGDVLAGPNFPKGVFGPPPAELRRVQQIKTAANGTIFLHTREALPFPFQPEEDVEVESRKREQEDDAARLLSFVKAAGGVTELEKVTVDAGFSTELVQQLIDAGELVQQNGLLWLPSLFSQQLGASRSHTAGSLVDQTLRGADPNTLLKG